MKLIVELPKEAYEKLRDKQDKNIAECIIADGTPYNPTDDLTSREALKKALTSETRDIYEFVCLSRVLEKIDNAPTVFDENAYSQGYKQATCDARASKERPQGDLIKAFELLKAHCKNRECNKDCVFYRELRTGNNIEQFCGLCEIVTSDDSENEKKNP